MDKLSKFGKFGNTKDKEKNSGSPLSGAHVAGGALRDDHAQIAKDAKQLLENSEELFKASLMAKNDEISKVNEVLKGVTDELAKELTLVHRLNTQLAVASNDLLDKEEALSAAKTTINELEQAKNDLLTRYTMVVDGSIAPEGSAGEAAKLREQERENVIDALRERAVAAEKEAYVLQGMVSGMQQMLTSLWEGREEEVNALRQRVRALEGKQSVWERESAMERERSNELLKLMAGKDEIIRSLQQRLSERGELGGAAGN